MRREIYRYFILTGLVVLLLAVYGCGKKENPRMQSLMQPVTLSNIEAFRDADSIVLRFTAAGKIEAVDEFTIMRNKLDINAGECPGCPRAYERIAGIGTRDLRAAGGRNGYTYRDNSVEKGYRYLYKIVVNYSRGTMGGEFLSEEVAFE